MNQATPGKKPDSAMPRRKRMATKLVSRIRQEFGVEPSLRCLYAEVFGSDFSGGRAYGRRSLFLATGRFLYLPSGWLDRVSP